MRQNCNYFLPTTMKPRQRRCRKKNQKMEEKLKDSQTCSESKVNEHTRYRKFMTLDAILTFLLVTCTNIHRDYQQSS